jgi:hypothetical protein
MGLEQALVEKEEGLLQGWRGPLPTMGRSGSELWRSRLKSACPDICWTPASVRPSLQRFCRMVKWCGQNRGFRLERAKKHPRVNGATLSFPGGAGHLGRKNDVPELGCDTYRKAGREWTECVLQIHPAKPSSCHLKDQFHVSVHLEPLPLPLPPIKSPGPRD